MARFVCYTLTLLLFSTRLVAGEAVINFKKSSTAVLPDEFQKLQPLISELNANPALDVTIEDYVGDLKPRQQAYLVAHARTLQIFQELVSKGINPGRITYTPRSTNLSKGFVTATTVLTSASDQNARLVPTRIPSGSAQGGISEFRFLFASASATHLPLDQSVLDQFLASVGLPGNDAILIEGYTDTRGNVVYNEFLSQLRALHVFELLVRAGLPPYRFTAKGMGVDTTGAEALSEEDQAARRRVVVRWIEDATIAAVARDREEKPAEKAEEKAPEPEKEPEPAPKEEKSPWQIITTFGLIKPLGALSDHAKQAGQFGIGVGKQYYRGATTDARAVALVTSASKHEPKEDDRAGTLNLQFLRVRSDVRWHLLPVKPYVGAGANLLIWNGTITEPSSARANTRKKNDVGFEATLGADIPVSESFQIGPEVSWHSFSGKFGESVLSYLGAIKWEI